ncbi:MAG: bifunctional riboflavin kinase/FAD synthetase [Pseudomonadota bacterium]
MERVTGYRNLAEGLRGCSVAIGNFDGVHKGHQTLIADARAAGGPAGVITFDPHPRRFFQPDAPPFCLTTPAEKARRLERHGVDILYEIPFDADLSGMAAEDFVTDVLCDGLGIRHLSVGADFRFGKARKGDSVLLRKIGLERGFGVTIHELVGDETGEFASTAIRAMIQEGRCREAAQQLGCWHTVSGPVVQGDQRGRDLGYPTANLAYDGQLIPKYGVYATWVDVFEGPHVGRFSGVASLGERPTFGVNAPNFEVHLFDFTGDLYGIEISVSLVEYLRGEVAFDGIEALIVQMDDDSARSREVLAAASIPK